MRNGHDHAAILADCALDLVDSTLRLYCTPNMSIHVGINTGKARFSFVFNSFNNLRIFFFQKETEKRS